MNANERLNKLFSEARNHKSFLDKSEAKAIIEKNILPRYTVNYSNNKGKIIMSFLSLIFGVTVGLLIIPNLLNIMEQPTKNHTNSRREIVYHNELLNKGIKNKGSTSQLNNSSGSVNFNYDNTVLQEDDKIRIVKDKKSMNVHDSSANSIAIANKSTENIKNTKMFNSVKIPIKSIIRGVKEITLTNDELAKLGVSRHINKENKLFMRIILTSENKYIISDYYKKGSQHELTKVSYINRNDTNLTSSFAPTLITDNDGQTRAYETTVIDLVDDSSSYKIEVKTSKNKIPDYLKNEIRENTNLKAYIYGIVHNNDLSQMSYTLGITLPSNMTSSDSILVKKLFEELNISENYLEALSNKVISKKNVLSRERINKLIPIKISFESMVESDIISKDNDLYFILWYKPTDQLLSILPENISVSLRKELNLAKDGDYCGKLASIGKEPYFEVWRSCSGAIENMLLYPNPSLDKTFNIKFTLTKSRILSISLHDLSGKKIMDLDNSISCQKGETVKTYYAKNINSGIYLVSIQTDKSEKTVQRIIFK